MNKYISINFIVKLYNIIFKLFFLINENNLLIIKLLSQ